MQCPFCNAPDTKVIDLGLLRRQRSATRRRECTACSERFTTYEVAELVMRVLLKAMVSRHRLMKKSFALGCARPGEASRQR